MQAKQKKNRREPSHGLKSQVQRQAKRRETSDMYRRLYERVKGGEGGPEKVFNAAVREGVAKGLSLTTFKRKCADPEQIGKEWEANSALPAECESELVDFWWAPVGAPGGLP